MAKTFTINPKGTTITEDYLTYIDITPLRKMPKFEIKEVTTGFIFYIPQSSYEWDYEWDWDKHKSYVYDTKENCQLALEMMKAKIKKYLGVVKR